MGETASQRGYGPPLAAALAERLRARIAGGELQPGDRLPGERELAEDLGVHRGSLREALRQLERLRLVATRPGSGTRVLDPQHASFDLVGEQLALDASGRWLRDLLEVRELVATGALRLLFERHARDSAALRETIRTLDAIAAPSVPLPAFLDALWELPASLARASGNQVLVLLANSTSRFLQGVGQGPTPRCARVEVGEDARPVGKPSEAPCKPRGGPAARSEAKPSEAPCKPRGGPAARSEAKPSEGSERKALTALVRRFARALDARDAERAEQACRNLGRKLGVWGLTASAGERAQPGSG